MAQGSEYSRTAVQVAVFYPVSNQRRLYVVSPVHADETQPKRLTIPEEKGIIDAPNTINRAVESILNKVGLAAVYLVNGESALPYVSRNPFGPTEHPVGRVFHWKKFDGPEGPVIRYYIELAERPDAKHDSSRSHKRVDWLGHLEIWERDESMDATLEEIFRKESGRFGNIQGQLEPHVDIPKPSAIKGVSYEPLNQRKKDLGTRTLEIEAPQNEERAVAGAGK